MKGISGHDVFMFKNFEKNLVEVCKDKKINLKSFKLDNGFNFYYIKSKVKNPIFVFAGIHGEEPAGPLAVLEFLEENTLPEDVFLLPLVNPYGFNRGIRYNDKKQDINRRFCDDKLENEALYLKKLFDLAKPRYLITLHEYYGNNFFCYASEKENKKLKQIIKIAKKYFKIQTKDNGYNSIWNGYHYVQDGFSWLPEAGYKKKRDLSTFENYSYANNVQFLCTETPTKLDFNRRINCQTDILKWGIKNL